MCLQLGERVSACLHVAVRPGGGMGCGEVSAEKEVLLLALPGHGLEPGTISFSAVPNMRGWEVGTS